MFTEKNFYRLFIVLSFIYLFCIIIDATSLVFYLKPLLILPLIATVIVSGKKPFRQLLLAALVFSWMGDVLLLFSGTDEMYFIFGLVAFLTAHIFYIILFIKEIKKVNGTFRWNNAILPVVIGYLFLLLYLLFPYLNELKIPVIIYGCVISVMLFAAWQLSYLWNKPASLLILAGAVSFVISDSLLAVNKFYQPFPLAGLLIMATYLFAQGALVRGWLRG